MFLFLLYSALYFYFKGHDFRRFALSKINDIWLSSFKNSNTLSLDIKISVAYCLHFCLVICKQVFVKLASIYVFLGKLSAQSRKHNWRLAVTISFV